MDKLAASRTALATSLMRAAHTRLDPHPLIEDAWGDRLVPESVRAAVLDQDLLQSRAYPNVITRSRYAEDALRRSSENGIAQYVLIGAGFDSFILRRPAFSAELQIFEIDFPATQALKLERIAGCEITLPGSVHFIAADLSQESVASALARSPYRPDRLTFFSWLGVTMYLTRQANLTTLKSVASCAPPGSELVFTYFDERLFQARSETFQELERRVASVGEPFLSGFRPAALGADLAECGLELIEDLSGGEVAARYDPDGQRGLGQSAFSHIALARVRSN
ncbi:MAG TPA: SAM-dependent methyltransferase [Steroidobacteraceae bacterium]|jgi:methyltransferase (TIGR00027 family)|nr:SAM-dependent methyltransferase [Steroidobacteraceae bacterium]